MCYYQKYQKGKILSYQMRNSIDKTRSESAYLQLYRRLREDICQGLYPWGQRLPSGRQLAGELGLSLVTVAHAYALLCDEGYAEARERSGYYVIYRDEDLLHPAEALSLPVPPPQSQRQEHSFPFSVLAKTARRVLAEQGDRLLVKSPNQGCLELRQAIAGYLARSRGIHVPSSRIFIGSGSEYLYGLIPQLLGRNRIYAGESPGYDKIRQVYEANGLHFEPLKMGPDGILSEALAQSRARVLHVTPFRSYPSGVSCSASKKREYLRWAAQRDAILVEDDYDSEFTLSSKAEDSLFSLDAEGRVIYLNSFSKSIAPSIRVGYMLLPEPLSRLYEEKLSFYSCPVPLLEQHMLAQLLQRGDFERHINRVRRRLRQEPRTPQAAASL